ncbi:hypothetical protein GpartN1_g5921.t1 [Galdieria partita]|uniref:RING-type domain-containing protein n=1 Tax=Galdieria partita TaxID=83374 RepID=A0A9C7Q1F5_9RHOD|nr:hypothetical protein GpartN1_g5921.t1 [Galdieria partita]
MGNAGSSIWDVSPSRPLGEYFSEDGRRSSLQYWNNRVLVPRTHTETNHTTNRTHTQTSTVQTRNGSRPSSTSSRVTQQARTGSSHTRSNTSSADNTRRSTRTGNMNVSRRQSSSSQTTSGRRSNTRTSDETSNFNRMSNSSVQRNTYLGGQSVQNLVERKMLAPWENGKDEPRDSSREDCPICFAFYTFLNYTACCNKPICTNCFITMHKVRRRGTTSMCPFCNAEPMEIVFYGESTPQRLMEEALRDSVSRQVNQLIIEISIIQKSWEEQPEIIDLLKNSGEKMYEDKQDIFNILPKQVCLSGGKTISLVNLYNNTESCISTLVEELSANDLNYVEAVFRSLHDICFRILADIALYAKIELGTLRSTSVSLSVDSIVGGKHSYSPEYLRSCYLISNPGCSNNDHIEENLIVFSEGDGSEDEGR